MKIGIYIGSFNPPHKGHIYVVIAIAKDSEDLTEKIVYQDLNNPDNIWVRDKLEFLSLVDKEKYPNVLQKERFEKISDN